MRVLLVSPHFPPTNAADMQRVRQVLPYLKAEGCEAEVLAVGAEGVACPVDPWLEAGLPAEVPVHRVKILGPEARWIPGMGSLSFRAIPALRREGDRLLAGGRFDLVYFSTTQFGVHLLGPKWLRKWGVPFAMDYQDPWVSDYYSEHPDQVPPGGRLKFWIADRLNRWMEPQVLKECAGVTAVSGSYIDQLRRRYAFLSQAWPTLVLPFAALEADWERVVDDGVGSRFFDKNDGRQHWVYAGRGGRDMEPALRAIFLAMQALPRDFLTNLCFHFIGTSYAPAGLGVATVAPLAAEYGLGEVVREMTDRVPYVEVLRCLRDAGALVVPGSDDPAYTASKMYPYLMARKPLLTVFHKKSPVQEVLAATGGAVRVGFASGESPEVVAQRIVSEWIEPRGWEWPRALEAARFADFCAPAAACQLVDFFRRCVP